eukprot:m.99174 g.99174  ORF g.99174 m.99174 type:complete len:400 (+) comp10299_c0_seq3:2620-3819(+)
MGRVEAGAPYTYTVPQGSLLYTEVLSPYIYTPICALYPRWLHPNVLTFLGMVAAWASCLVVVFNSPTLGGEGDPWVYFVSAACFAMYIVFDNTDGKQARRIKMSSAAGETFDHGVDVTVTTLGMMVVADATQMPTSMLVVQLLASHVTTFVNNWHHKITGHMSWGGRYLSVDEATLVTVLIVLGAGVCGPDWYGTTMLTGPGYNPFRHANLPNGTVAVAGTVQLDMARWGGMTFGDSLAMFSWFYSTFDTLIKIPTTLSQVDGKEGSGRTMKDAITSLAPLFAYVALALRVFYNCAPVDPVTSAALCGVVFSCIGLRLVVSMKFDPESVPYRLHTAATVAAFGTVYALTTMPDCATTSSQFAAGQFAWVVAAQLYAIHLMTFVHALSLINEGRPLFYCS